MLVSASEMDQNAAARSQDMAASVRQRRCGELVVEIGESCAIALRAVAFRSAASAASSSQSDPKMPSAYGRRRMISLPTESAANSCARCSGVAWSGIRGEPAVHAALPVRCRAATDRETAQIAQGQREQAARSECRRQRRQEAK